MHKVQHDILKHSSAFRKKCLSRNQCRNTTQKKKK